MDSSYLKMFAAKRTSGRGRGLLMVVAVVGVVVLCVVLGGWGLSLSARIVFGMKL